MSEKYFKAKKFFMKTQKELKVSIRTSPFKTRINKNNLKGNIGLRKGVLLLTKRINNKIRSNLQAEF